MSNLFYRAFEDRHRGARDDIKKRLEVYLPFIGPVAEMHPGAYVLDLGCGRGEWLQLLQENGIQGHGVDLDEGMLSACHAHGLHVEKGDALDHLCQLPDQSVLTVTAFHLVEHIGFEALHTLVHEAFRALLPGGLLIMETPNPENIVVATKNFYIDPSHIKPIPPELLAFLPEHLGYSNVKTLRLQENPATLKQHPLNLEDILGGCSPDYAIVAQKQTLHENPESLKAAFSKEYGISTSDLAQRYSGQQMARHALIEQRILETEASLEQLQVQLKQVQERDQQLRAQMDALATSLQAVYSSRSLRMTAPLTWVFSQCRRLKQEGVVQRFKALIRKISSKLQSPENAGVVKQPQTIDPCRHLLVKQGVPDEAVDQLSPHARRILVQLNEAQKTKAKD